jgi:hypothetical protein
MKKLILPISIAFLISLAIHFLLYTTVDLTIKNNQLKISTTNKKQNIKKNGFVSVKYVKMKKPKIKKEKIVVRKKQLKLKKEIKKLEKKLIKVPIKIKKRKTKKRTVKKKPKAIELPKINKQADLKFVFLLHLKVSPFYYITPLLYLYLVVL